MKTKLFFYVNAFLLMPLLFLGQTSTELFETETHDSNSFTDNGVVFSIISHSGTFDIQGNYPGTGWGGTVNDNRYIDNSSSVATNPSFSIKTTSNLFKVNKFWMFLSNLTLNQNVVGTLTVTGKLSGVNKFSQTKSTGFATSLGTTNGYTLIDMTNLNGQNYSNIVIDQLQITLGGAYTYAGLDAFTWVKDSGLVLATNEANPNDKKTIVYPNPTNGILYLDSDVRIQAEIYNPIGVLIKKQAVERGKNTIDITSLPSGNYLIKLNEKTQSIIKR